VMFGLPSYFVGAAKRFLQTRHYPIDWPNQGVCFASRADNFIEFESPYQLCEQVEL